METSVQQRGTLTGPDMLTNAAGFRKRMSEVVSRIDTLLVIARKEKDIIRINCLLDNLVQVKASLNVADKAFVTMKDAIDIQNQETAFYQYTRITLLNQNVQTVINEAEVCVGADLSFVGQTRVDVDIQGVPEENSSTSPRPPSQDENERPPSASPYY